MMITIVYMAKETFSSIRSLKYLCTECNDIEVAAAIVRQEDFTLIQICNEYNIKIISEIDLESHSDNNIQNIDYIFSYYWKKIKPDILNIPRLGSINFHPGPLPEARGSGYHAAILEDWGYWGVTAHYMDEEFDTGKIICCRRFPIQTDIVNKDLVKLTHEKLYELFVDIVNMIHNNTELPARVQSEGRYFSKIDLETLKQIAKDDTVEDIERKIRAFWNPPYTGAQISIAGKDYTIINDQILEWISNHIV